MYYRGVEPFGIRGRNDREKRVGNMGEFHVFSFGSYMFIRKNK